MLDVIFDKSVKGGDRGRRRLTALFSHTHRDTEPSVKTARNGQRGKNRSGRREGHMRNVIVSRRNKNVSRSGWTPAALASRLARYCLQPRGTRGRTGGGRRSRETNTHGNKHFLKGNVVAADSPGHLHERYGHGGGVDGQVAVQINDDADVEHVDAH